MVGLNVLFNSTTIGTIADDHKVNARVIFKQIGRRDERIYRILKDQPPDRQHDKLVNGESQRAPEFPARAVRGKA